MLLLLLLAACGSPLSTVRATVEDIEYDIPTPNMVCIPTSIHMYTRMHVGYGEASRRLLIKGMEDYDCFTVDDTGK